MRRLSLFAGTATLVLASCTTVPQPAPQPAPPIPVPVPAPSPTPAPPPQSADWRDWPLTPGTWAYRQDARGSIALFGRAGQDADLTLRCDRARARLYLSRRADGEATTLTVRTSTTLRRVPVLPTGGTPAYLAAELAANDALIDAIGFSRGRFVVEGAPGTLVVPAWPEVLRVAEDCRG